MDMSEWRDCCNVVDERGNDAVKSGNDPVKVGAVGDRVKDCGG